MTTRTWSYTWAGDDLERIDRPDGTAWRFVYDGFLRMTRMILVGTDASERVEQAWSYDAFGNVVQTWKGANSFDDAAATEKWELSYDKPRRPEETMVTDPLGVVTTYQIDWPGSKPRITQVSGDCPTCGLGPNSQIFYFDGNNPQRPSREINGRGVITEMSYDLNGQLISKIEAFGTALEREMTWDYDPTYPAFPTRVEQPSSTGNPLDLRVTTLSYDPSGNQDTRTAEGIEDGSPFFYETTTSYNAAGQPTSIDPPGHGSADETSFTYDPARGNLIAADRTDPLIGTTTFGYDPFNRRVSVTDPNGVITETTYDLLSRVRFITQKGASPSEDLITEHRYTVFGDLFQTILPEGNVIEYSYDTAGRLVAIERKPDTNPASHGERVSYQLDNFGHRIREEQQRWDGGAWVVDAATEYEYSTRCHLERMIQGAASDRVYGYRDYQYFLTSGNGPWGNQSWTYDKIGNRLSQTRNGVTDGYSYVPGTSGNNPKLNQISLGSGGTETFSYDAIGSQTQIASASEATDYIYDDDKRLTAITLASGEARTDFANDGRSFLRSSVPSRPVEVFADDWLRLAVRPCRRRVVIPIVRHLRHFSTSLRL